MVRLTTLVLVAAAGLALVATPSVAAPIKVGEKAPVFSGLEAADGKSYSLDDMKGKDVVVVCITCNHCPVAVAYEDRIIKFAKKYAGKDSKVGFIAINVNNNDQDKLDKMKERAKEKGFNFPYAYDPSQKIARELGASVTPEFFVFDKDRRVVYTGAFDDNNREDRATKTYLADAVEATLKGEKIKVSETKGRGCGIQFERTR